MRFPKEAVEINIANGRFVRTAAVQPQKIAAPCINDRFSRGTVAVEGCVSRPKGTLCKGRFLRTVDVGTACHSQPISAFLLGLSHCRRLPVQSPTVGKARLQVVQAPTSSRTDQTGVFVQPARPT